jgi:hypothetical protein
MSAILANVRRLPVLLVLALTGCGATGHHRDRSDRRVGAEQPA